jgi:hypothetical protein
MSKSAAGKITGSAAMLWPGIPAIIKLAIQPDQAHIPGIVGQQEQATGRRRQRDRSRSRRQPGKAWIMSVAAALDYHRNSGERAEIPGDTRASRDGSEQRKTAPAQTALAAHKDRLDGKTDPAGRRP